MKDRKRVKVLLKVIKRVYYQNPNMQKVIKVFMVEVNTEEVVSCEQVFFLLLFFLFFFFFFSIMSYSNKWVEDINILFVKEATYENSKAYFKRRV